MEEAPLGERRVRGEAGGMGRSMAGDARRRDRLERLFFGLRRGIARPRLRPPLAAARRRLRGRLPEVALRRRGLLLAVRLVKVCLSARSAPSEKQARLGVSARRLRRRRAAVWLASDRHEMAMSVGNLPGNERRRAARCVGCTRGTLKGVWKGIHCILTKRAQRR